MLCNAFHEWMRARLPAQRVTSGRRDSTMQELKQEQRYLPALRAHIDQLLSKGWVIIARNPLQLRSGTRTYLVMHGMLIGEGLH